MTVFLLSCALIVVLVMVVLLRPLLAQKAPPSTIEPTLQDLSAKVLREQLEQLEADYKAGQVGQAPYEASKAELQKRALQELDAHKAPPTSANPLGYHSAKKTALMLAVALPVLAGGLYAWLGSPASLDPARAKQAQMDAQNTMIKGMVAKLAKRLETNPDDLEGWARLARSYKVLGNNEQAAQAYAKALPFVEKQPDLLVDYAEVLAVQDQNDLNKRALAMVQKGLALDAKHPMSLVIAGAAAYQREDFDTAVALWQRLVPLVEPGSEDAKQVLTNLADAKEKAAAQRQAAAGTKK